MRKECFKNDNIIVQGAVKIKILKALYLWLIFYY